MIGYKIRLFSHLSATFHPKVCSYFLEFSKNKFDDIFKELELLKTEARLNFIYNPFNEQIDLDLFKAQALHKKLTDLGVNCAIVKVDYKNKTFKQID